MAHVGVMSLAAKQVCLEPVERAACTDFVAKSRTAPSLPRRCS